MATDISEAGLEKIISDYLVEVNGYELGKAAEFSKEYALDEGRVLRFLQATQPEKVKAAHILDSEYERNKFFVSLRKKLGEAGIVDLLRNGFRYLAYKFDLYYSTPSEQKSDGESVVYPEHFQCHEAGDLFHGISPIGFGFGNLYKRLANRYIRTEEQTDQTKCR